MKEKWWRDVRIVITGSRDWMDRRAVELALGELRPCPLAHGGCRGADLIAGEVARALGYTVMEYAVDHVLDGPWPGAGPRRNGRMLREFRPTLVIAFPMAKSRGTWDCVRQAERAGIRTIVVQPRAN